MRGLQQKSPQDEGRGVGVPSRFVPPCHLHQTTPPGCPPSATIRTVRDFATLPITKPLTPPANVTGRGGGTPLYFSTGSVAGGVKGFEMTRSKMGFPTKPLARDSLTPSFVCKQQRGVVGAPGTLQIGETWPRISTATGIRPLRERFTSV